MIETIYALCGLASLVCTVLLFRGYAQGRSRLLLWSAICFAALTANNFILFADEIVFPDINLSYWRSGAALVGIMALLYGLVCDADRKEPSP